MRVGLALVTIAIATVLLLAACGGGNKTVTVIATTSAALETTSVPEATPVPDVTSTSALDHAAAFTEWWQKGARDDYATLDRDVTATAGSADMTVGCAQVKADVVAFQNDLPTPDDVLTDLWTKAMSADLSAAESCAAGDFVASRPMFDLASTYLRKATARLNEMTKDIQGG
jgi:hypothetical protein